MAMTPTETLKHEHQIILLVLEAAQREAETIRQSGRFDEAKVRKFLEFFREFVDRCHHSKEEKHLFAQMEGAAPESAGPISMMLREHQEGRRMLGVLAAAVEKSDAASGAASANSVREGLLAYADLLRQHIFKEDSVLYPLAERVLDEDDRQELAEGFELVESQELGAGTHEKYHQLAHELAGKHSS
jgi:hemerythrin-like domain-containing protein